MACVQHQLNPHCRDQRNFSPGSPRGTTEEQWMKKSGGRVTLAEDNAPKAKGQPRLYFQKFPQGSAELHPGDKPRAPRVGTSQL